MEKLLTISIAAYNVENFIKNTLKSLVIDDLDKIEVLIINDGSKDSTSSIAMDFTQEYPNTFKLIEKENGGYGSTINCGIKNATGKYFKQLDGDDWYDTANLNAIISQLKYIESDVVYTPYIIVYEDSDKIECVTKVENKEYKNIDDYLKDAGKLSMHNLMYKTELLKNNKISIDENCFYTDTEYVVYPLIYSKTITTVSLPLYMYRMGREGQSISSSGRIKHYKDHVRVCNNLTTFISKDLGISKIKKEYLNNYIAEILATCIGGFWILLKPSKEIYANIQKFDDNIKKQNLELYNLMSQYSNSVNVIRKKSYLKYKALYYYKLIKRKIK